jgi:lipoate-protein ligase A
MTECRLLLDPAADGAWNMAVDELLLDQAAETGRPTLRFYSWKEATVSLGYFQSYASRLGHAASSRCPLVRRLTGGGAIVHDAELTYSLALPAGHPGAARTRDLYRAVHDALVETLGLLGARAEICDGGAGRTPLVEPFLCFQRRAAGDVLIDGEKIAGSAQRRRRGAILQHGSVALRTSDAAPEVPGLEALAGIRLMPAELANYWGVRLRDRLGLRWLHEPLSDADSSTVRDLCGHKYAADAWSQSR